MPVSLLLHTITYHNSATYIIDKRHLSFNVYMFYVKINLLSGFHVMLVLFLDSNSKHQIIVLKNRQHLRTLQQLVLYGEIYETLR